MKYFAPILTNFDIKKVNLRLWHTLFFRWLMQQHLRISNADVKDFIDYFRKFTKDANKVDKEAFRKILSTKNDFFSDRIFDLADINQDGQVCIDEYTEFMTKLAVSDKSDAIRFLFRIFDVNGKI